jgi:hypothetical protein
MGWSIGYDHNHERDIGYGVPAVCDHPGCNEEVYRGIDAVCGGEPYGGDKGCGLYFCGSHLFWKEHAKKFVCDRCLVEAETYYKPKPDTLQWVSWKFTDESWGPWREENPEEVANLKQRIEQETSEVKA